MQAAGGPCPACHGSGVGGDLDPATLSRLQRWATYSPQGRARVAAALPEARVAGPWVLPEGYGGYRYDLNGERVGYVHWHGAWWWGEVGSDDAATYSDEMETAELARDWCDEQLRAAGWVLA